MGAMKVTVEDLPEATDWVLVLLPSSRCQSWLTAGFGSLLVKASVTMAPGATVSSAGESDGLAGYRPSADTFKETGAPMVMFIIGPEELIDIEWWSESSVESEEQPDGARAHRAARAARDARRIRPQDPVADLAFVAAQPGIFSQERRRKRT